MPDMPNMPAMPAAFCTLLCFAALTVGLALTYVSYRIAVFFAGKTAANSWKRGAETWKDPAIIVRIHHAHLNCVENLPVYAAVVLGAYATQQLAVVNPLAGVFLGLRLAQSTTHILNDNAAFVFVRANLWVAQMLIMAYWIGKLCHWI